MKYQCSMPPNKQTVTCICTCLYKLDLYILEKRSNKLPFWYIYMFMLKPFGKAKATLKIVCFHKAINTVIENFNKHAIYWKWRKILLTTSRMSGKLTNSWLEKRDNTSVKQNGFPNDNNAKTTAQFFNKSEIELQ